MYQNINKIYHAAIYVRLSKEDGDISSSAKLESNSISNQKALILDFLKQFCVKGIGQSWKNSADETGSSSA